MATGLTPWSPAAQAAATPPVCSPARLDRRVAAVVGNPLALAAESAACAQGTGRGTALLAESTLAPQEPASVSPAVDPSAESAAPQAASPASPEQAPGATGVVAVESPAIAPLSPAPQAATEGESPSPTPSSAPPSTAEVSSQPLAQPPSNEGTAGDLRPATPPKDPFPQTPGVGTPTPAPSPESAPVYRLTPGPDLSSPSATPAPQPAVVPGQASQQATDLSPESLRLFESDPNPLVFPTLPEEVKILLTRPITLEQAIEIGRLNSRDVMEARLNVERSRAGLRQAIAANYPRLALSSTLTRSLSSGTRRSIINQNNALRDQGRFFEQTDIDRSTQLAISGGFDLTYNIYTGGSRSAGIAAAQAQLRADELALEAVSADYEQSIADGYYRLQQENAQLKIDQVAVQFREQSVRDAQALERAGLGTRFEILQAQVELANDRQAVVQTRDRQTQRRRELARLLALPHPIDIDTADPIAKAGDWTLSIEQTIVLAYRNRAELERQLVVRDFNEAQRRGQLSRLRPQLTLSGRYEWTDIWDPPGDTAGIVDGYSLSLQMNWTIFDGGEARALARREELGVAIAENAFARQREQIRFQVEQGYSALLANAENIKTALEAITAAQEEVRLARLRFQAGVGTQTDRLNAETRLTRARGNVLIAIVSYNRALAALRRAVTNLPPDVIVPPADPVILPPEVPVEFNNRRPSPP